MSAVAVQPVGDDEVLARFVLRKDWVRNDQTLRPEAFIPHPHKDLSVTRHLARPDTEIWENGKSVAANRVMTLHGRADFAALAAIGQNLRVDADSQPENPHHALVLGWPPEKAVQKIKALALAAAARFVQFAISES